MGLCVAARPAFMPIRDLLAAQCLMELFPDLHGVKRSVATLVRMTRNAVES